MTEKQQERPQPEQKLPLEAPPSGASSEAERQSWARPAEFLLSCLSYAVGLGNVWRFPYLVYRNGGGAFLIPYVLMLFTMGLPLFFLELAIGQYSGLGANVAFFRMAPLFQGLGYSVLLVIYLITLYYHLITAWTLFYTFASFSSELGWGHCRHDFNDERCFSDADNKGCLALNETHPMTFWKLDCFSVEEMCQNRSLVILDADNCFNETSNTTVPLRHLLDRVMASEQYYQDAAMGINGHSWDDWGAPRWEMVGLLLLAWLIAYACLVRGVQSMGKAVYFTAIFPYVVLTALLIRGATLPGAAKGVLFYIKPDFSRLASPEVWGDAASQTFYALGIGCASLVTLSSYNRFSNNCHRDAVFVALANLLTALYAGFGVFCVLGFMAEETGRDISEVVESGPGLAFIAYPEAILRMPGAQFWAVLFFLMLFVLGLGSQFAGVETMSAAVLDLWPRLRPRKWAVTGAVCLSCFLLGLPMCCPGGVFLVTLLDWHTAYWAIFLLGVAEVAVVAYVYGVDRFIDNLADMGMRLSAPTRGYWKVAWLVLTPVTLLGVVSFTLYSFTDAYFGSYVFPSWVDALGWLIGVSTLLPVPAFALYRLMLGHERGMELLRPRKTWGPQSPGDSTPAAGADGGASAGASPRLSCEDPANFYSNPAFESDTNKAVP